MIETVRPMRADAARNRARVLEVAYDTFRTEGLAVPIDEIARRAGVGPGTIYRHFPNKEALFRAVVEERVQSILVTGRDMIARDPGTALFEFLREMVRAAADDHAIADALDGDGLDFKAVAEESGAEESFTRLLGELLVAGQGAGTVRRDVGPEELKTLLSVCKSTHGCDARVVEGVTRVIEAGLRA